MFYEYEIKKNTYEYNCNPKYEDLIFFCDRRKTLNLNYYHDKLLIVLLIIIIQYINNINTYCFELFENTFN